jgi:hypothetical protein
MKCGTVKTLNIIIKAMPLSKVDDLNLSLGLDTWSCTEVAEVVAGAMVSFMAVFVVAVTVEESCVE